MPVWWGTFSPDNLRKPDVNVIYEYYSWNIPRYVSDFAHLFALVLLLGLIAKERNIPRGLSFNSRAFYLGVFSIRYYDLFSGNQLRWLFCFKLFYIMSSASIVGLFFYTKPLYQLLSDPLDPKMTAISCFLSTILLSYGLTFEAYSWTFSQCLECVAMLPQYLTCYTRKGTIADGIYWYIYLMALYRFTALLSWMRKKYQFGFVYADLPFPIFDVILTFDFLLFRLWRKSFIIAKVSARLIAWKKQREEYESADEEEDEAFDLHLGSQSRRRQKVGSEMTESLTWGLGGEERYGKTTYEGEGDEEDVL